MKYTYVLTPRPWNTLACWLHMKDALRARGLHGDLQLTGWFQTDDAIITYIPSDNETEGQVREVLGLPAPENKIDSLSHTD